MKEETEFYLPIGLTDSKGTLHRKGVMRAVTAEDELELQESDGVQFNDRQRDLELLARLIISLGSLPQVGPDSLMELYEADFLYLQMLFNSVNSGAKPRFRCPSCGAQNDLDVPTLFKTKDTEETKTECGFSLPQGSGLKPEIGTKVKGKMQMSRCKDYITLYRDERARRSASWYYVGLLTRSVKKLGAEKAINTGVISKLTPRDFSFLVDLFNELNNGVVRSIKSPCSCGSDIRVELSLPGEA